MKRRVMVNPISISCWERLGLLAKRKNLGFGLFVMVIRGGVGSGEWGMGEDEEYEGYKTIRFS